MKKSNFAIAIALTLMACSIASASLLDLGGDDSRLRVGSIVKAYNSSFNVTGEENFYVQNGDFITKYRIIFLENLDKITSISKQVSSLEQSLTNQSNISSQMQDMISYKRNDNLQLAARLTSLGKETSILSNQSNMSLAASEIIKSNEADLEGRVTGNFLITPNQTTGLLVIFTILIAAVIVIEFRAYFYSGKAETKPDKKSQEAKK